jgi:hypothetical protein
MSARSAAGARGSHTAPRRARRGRRIPAPPAAFGWRWLFPALLAGLGVVALLLSAAGARLVLDSRDGTVGRAVTDPTQPGYTEAVAPTPTILVVHGDGEGNLYNVMVLSLGPDDQGGRGAVLSPDMRVDMGDGEPRDLADVYEEFGVEDIDNGGIGVRSAVSALFAADVDRVVTVDATSLAPLVEPVAPLEYELEEPVRATRGTVLPAGPVELLTADDIADATEALGPDETPLERADRQIAFWDAWIESVAQEPDPAAAFPAGTDTGDLARFVIGMGAGEHSIDVIPFVPFGAPVPVPEEVQELSLEMIPFPQQAGVRITVAVRNGTGDATLDDPMFARLVAAGAQIVSRGNADAFGVDKTVVTIHDETYRAQGQALADAIGSTVELQTVAILDSQLAATVTIGEDFEP